MVARWEDPRFRVWSAYLREPDGGFEPGFYVLYSDRLYGDDGVIGAGPFRTMVAAEYAEPGVEERLAEIGEERAVEALEVT